MKREHLQLEDAIEQGLQLPYGFAKSYSAVALGKNPLEFDIEELMEVRFFDTQQEIRLFRRDGALQAVRLQCEQEDFVMYQSYLLRDPARFGKKIKVCQLLETDEDGQVYIAATQLAGWEGAEDNG